MTWKDADEKLKKFHNKKNSLLKIKDYSGYNMGIHSEVLGKFCVHSLNDNNNANG